MLILCLKSNNLPNVSQSCPAEKYWATTKKLRSNIEEPRNNRNYSQYPNIK